MVETYTLFLLEIQLEKLSIIHAQLKLQNFFWRLPNCSMRPRRRVELKIVGALGEILRCHSDGFGSIEIKIVVKTQVAI